MQPFYRSYVVSIFVSLAISIGLQMILPWPFGLVAAVAVFMLYPLILRNRTLKRMGGMSSISGGGVLGNGIRYVCLVCSNKFNGILCPRCGSKMKKAEF